MRIALFTETFVPKIDGIVTTLCETTRQLTRMGHEVLVVAPDLGVSSFENVRIEPVKGVRFPLYPELKLAIPHACLKDKVRDFAPDIIHVADPALLGVAGLYFSGGTNGGALGLPLVVSYHTDLPSYLHYYGLGILERYIWPIMRVRHNRATINLGTSIPILEQLRANGIERVELWPGGVDTARFQPARRCDEMRRRLSGGEPQKPILLYIGRLSAEKDLERLRPILQALPGTRLALVGDGPHHKAIEKHLAGLPVVLAGFLRGDELAAAYASADVFVMPSRTETLGLVVLEAMASGLPVVAARAGGIPDLIEDGVSGCLFDDERQAVSAIRDFLDFPERRTSFGSAARDSAIEKSWSHATEMLLGYYRTAQAAQRIVPVEEREPARGGFGPRTRRMARLSTRWALRRLFP